MKINYKAVLLVIFLLTFGFRLYIAFTNPTFSSDESYFNLRVTDHIIENKSPLLYDELSYSGKSLIYPQFFNYFLALFSFIPGYEKIIPALLISSIVLIVFLICNKITNNPTASLFSAFLSAFIPIEIKTNINQISVYSLLIPIILLMILCLLNLDNKKYFNLFIILTFLSPLIHPISFLFSLSLIFYLLLINTESIHITRAKKEVIVFAFFAILLINFFLYREALIRYGTNIIWLNIPGSLFDDYFNFNIIEVLYLLGIIPLIFGVIGIYTGLFKKKDPDILLLSSFMLSTLLLMALKLINLEVGVLFLSLPLLIASSKTLSNLYYYFSITKFAKYKKHFNLILFVLIIILSLIPSFLIATSLPNYELEKDRFTWIKLNTEPNSVVLAPYDMGNILTYYSERKNVVDNNFLLAPNVDERLSDAELIYKSGFEVKALELVEKYKINYIYTSPEILNRYNLVKIPYVDDSNCFEPVAENVYKVKC